MSKKKNRRPLFKCTVQFVHVHGTANIQLGLTDSFIYFDLILKIAQNKLFIARSLFFTKFMRFCFFQLQLNDSK